MFVEYIRSNQRGRVGKAQRAHVAVWSAWADEACPPYIYFEAFGE